MSHSDRYTYIHNDRLILALFAISEISPHRFYQTQTEQSIGNLALFEVALTIRSLNTRQAKWGYYQTKVSR